MMDRFGTFCVAIRVAIGVALGMTGLFLVLSSKNLYGFPVGVWEQVPNYERTYRCPRAEVFSPATIEDVQEIVALAIASNRTIMTSTRKFNSQADAACPAANQIHILTEHLTQITNYDTATKTVTAESGVRMRSLLDYLAKHGRSIDLVAEGGFFSLGGMLGSSTHGSSVATGASLGDYLVRARLVDGKGSIRTVEGDDLKAVRANIGVLGLVFDVTLRTEPLKKVKATIHTGDNAALLHAFQTLPKQHASAALAWFPGLSSYAATTYDYVPHNTPGRSYNGQADVPTWLIENFRDVYTQGQKGPSTGNLCELAKFRKSMRSQSYYKEPGATLPNPDAVGWSHHMTYFDCNRQGTCVWDILPFYIAGFALDTAQLPDWIQDAQKILDAHSTEEQVCLPLNGIYFRFASSSTTYLAPNYGRDTVYVDIEYFLNLNEAHKSSDFTQITLAPKHFAFYQELEQMTFHKYLGRPHWGKNHPIQFVGVGPSRYPAWDKFMAVKAQFDPENVFTNPFWERLLDPQKHKSYETAGCAFEGTCVCSNDEHCPRGHSCQAGLSYQEAKVCMPTL